MESPDILKAIEFDNVSFGYAQDEPLLDGLSFSVDIGEFVALVGRNGCGKSTIARMIDAFLLPSKGAVTINGTNLGELASKGANAILEFRCGIGFVQQNPDNQFVATKVVDEVAFGPSGLGIAVEDVLERTRDALDQVNASNLSERDVNTLSGGQKQRVAIADSLAMRPDIFIFDEPTSMLDADGRRDVMDIIGSLHAKGATIILITHSPSEAECADRIIEIDGGKAVEGSDILERDKEAFEKMVSRESEIAESGRGASTSDKVIDFVNVSFSYDPKDNLLDGLMGIEGEIIPVLSDFSMSVHEGELLCLTGPNGSGKSTISSLMNGLLKPDEGQVLVNGIPTTDRQGANSARRHVGVCFQYPEKSFFCQSVLDEAAFGPMNCGHIRQEAQKMARDAMVAVGLDPARLESLSPFDLSGGLQRRLALASVLSMRPKVLVMDEPCAALDEQAHLEIISLLLDLKAAGQTMVLITHDERDIKILGDRTLTLS